MLPDLKYASSHEWAKAQGETATVGISDHAQVRPGHKHLSCWLRICADTHNLPLQGELGDVVYVELPEVGSTVTKGETFGVVESVKVCGLLIMLYGYPSSMYSSCSTQVAWASSAFRSLLLQRHSEAFKPPWATELLQIGLPEH